jgi:type I restriction enzyme R subunit
VNAWRQPLDEMNLHAGQGASVGELIATGHGRADYLLFIDGTGAGAVEAKSSGTPLASPLHCASR